MPHRSHTCCRRGFAGSCAASLMRSMFTTSYYYQLLSYLFKEITYTSLTDEIDVHD